MVVAHLVPLGLRLGGVMQLLVLQRVLSRLASSGPPFRPRTGPTGREIDGEAQYSIRVHSGERRAPGINSLHGVTRGRDEHRESTHFTESLEGETSTGNQLTSRSHSRERRAPGINSLHGVTRGRDEHRESTHFTESLKERRAPGMVRLRCRARCARFGTSGPVTREFFQKDRSSEPNCNLLPMCYPMRVSGAGYIYRFAVND